MSYPKDTKASRAILQGAMAALVSKHLITSDSPIKVDAVYQDKDEDGDYYPYFTVEMGSGAMIRVSLEVDA